MTIPALFTPIRLGALELPNRIVMAPLTRSRALPEGDAPGPLSVDYYRQRASAGLIITEAAQISPEGKGYAGTPGIHSAAQTEAWSRVTEAVHAAGGRIFLQLWHVGRVSHHSLQPDGQPPVAPSAVIARTRTYVGSGFVPVSPPRALETGEIARIVADYRHAARNARAAGFDGIELHGANGYLIDQFLRDGPNRRTDAYGGSPENRCRFLVEVLEALTEIWPADRIGLRLSPFSPANDAGDSDPMALFSHVIERISGFGLAYLHLIEGETAGSRDSADRASVRALRGRFGGRYMANNGYDRYLAICAAETGAADLIAFGRPYIANPDLVDRLRRGLPLAIADRSHYYGGGAAGYTDYPAAQDR
ncbi:alkene reductase [Oceanibaculum pacificum]|uniref:Alkene reductase n=1 Tax=Oceanibaculum pacificum TaxID=580166 RepID=A0A154VRY2_9PROT|nr:alkene reductase [Oceanibaculum pacificum]KZD04097.1 alkene reductase [Oceanibaculum pacificum]